MYASAMKQKREPMVDIDPRQLPFRQPQPPLYLLHNIPNIAHCAAFKLQRTNKPSLYTGKYNPVCQFAKIPVFSLIFCSMNTKKGIPVYPAKVKPAPLFLKRLRDAVRMPIGYITQKI